ncbi:hypothetical protein ACFE04_031332 [Oxalis oulophora]
MGIIKFTFLFILFHYPAVAIPTFTPSDNFLLTCGNSNPVELEDGRIFDPDNSFSDVVLSPLSNFFISDNKTYSNLYDSARILNETTTFSFTIRQIGPHFLRLHFYPVHDHSIYRLKSAVFSVLCNGVTLLHGFSYSRIRKITPLLKEYVVEISEGANFVLTFAPWSGSIAFINAIELVSIPTMQYPFDVLPVPFGPAFEITDIIAFETVYRINMGGPLLTPKNDSLWRTWESDKRFLTNPASARSVKVDPSLVNYPDGEAAEIAPHLVYATAQEMAEANVSEQNFNISWLFEVEPNFRYFIRMHFCDIVSDALGNLIFNVYINKKAAIYSFDISRKTNELSTAYFIDFVTNASSSNHIMVQIGPPQLRNTRPNAILNGLEIMKLSNPSNSLDVNLDNKLKTPKKKNWMLVAISACCAGILVFALVLVALCVFCHRKTKPKCSPTVWLPVPTQMGNSDSKVSIFSLGSTVHSKSLGRVLSFSEIQEATNNFDEKLVIGVGGFGKVYKGMLVNGLTVAVKRGNPRSQQGLTEFRTEINMLTKLRHRHLVSLIGYCEEQNEMILVYEFMAAGPLRKHLYSKSNRYPPLTWKQRLEICIGAAKGLHYLHTGAGESIIIHRDVKTSNILLDENLNAKVSDFGLSKLGPTPDQTHVSTAVKGSFGYLDPEYYRRQQLTEKSDVYSFGVVMLEVLCARPAISPSLPREQVNIAEWAMNLQKKNQLEKIIDSRLIKCINLDSLRKFGETAQKCLAEYGVDRPTMGDVLWNLEYALQLQESCLQTSSENSANYIPDNIPAGWVLQGGEGVYKLTDNVSEEEFESANTRGVFSQLMNSKGR